MRESFHFLNDSHSEIKNRIGEKFTIFRGGTQLDIYLDVMKLDDVMDMPGRGLVLIGRNIDVEKQISPIKSLVGSNIIVNSIDGTTFNFEVIDVSVSFSIQNSPLIGINIKDRVSIDRIQKGSIVKKISDGARTRDCEKNYEG